MSKDKYVVFVYGTLRPTKTPGGWTHTLMGYSMYDYGAFPFILPEEGGHVRGELIAVDADELMVLDEYENIASGLYSREKVTVLSKEDGLTEVNAFVYVGNEGIIPSRIETGNWFSRKKF